MKVMKSRIVLIWIGVSLLSQLFAGENDPEILVGESAQKSVYVPKASLDSSWRRHVDFDDSSWEICSGEPGGVGYEINQGYEDFISLDVSDDMYESGTAPNTSCYIRIPFVLSSSTLEAIDALKIYIMYDDGFVAYLNGSQVASANAPEEIVWNSAAAATHEADDFESFDITVFKRRLNAGNNLLAIQGLNGSTNSSDFLIHLRLVSEEEPVPDFTVLNLPLVFIDTNGRNIPDEPKIDAHMGIIYHGVGQSHDLEEPFNDYDGRIGIETRGSSSQSWRKKQYAVETRDESSANLNCSLMGLPEENDWILNAPFIDKSFLRNVLTFDLSRRMGQYASRTRYCELFLNLEYRGIYILMEKIKRDNDRVDIAELDSTDVSGIALTGGYIFKVDKEDGAQNEGFNSKYLSANGSNRRVLYQYHYPSQNEIRPEQRQYLRNYVYDFEDMMQDNADNPHHSFADWIDIDSFLDFFLVSEIGKNVDSYRLSTFFYKDRDDRDDRLHIGPVWDYNLAFGLANYYDGEDTDDWMLETLLALGGNDFQVPFWWDILFRNYQFQQAIKDRWRELRLDVFDENRIDAYIDAVADTLDAAQQRNFIIWSAPGEPGEGFWPVPGIFSSFHSYQDEIDYLKYWIEERIAWMDVHIDQLTGVEESVSIPPLEYFLQQNYPNPFNSSTTLKFTLAEPAHVSLCIYDIRGQKVKTLLNESLANDEHNLVWNSEDELGLPVASGVYFCKLNATTKDGSFNFLRKITLLR